MNGTNDTLVEKNYCRKLSFKLSIKSNFSVWFNKLLAGDYLQCCNLELFYYLTMQ